MALLSDLLKCDPRLEACLTDDPAHLIEGTVGSHVAKVQLALLVAEALRPVHGRRRVGVQDQTPDYKLQISK